MYDGLESALGLLKQMRWRHQTVREGGWYGKKGGGAGKLSELIKVTKGEMRRRGTWKGTTDPGKLQGLSGSTWSNRK